MPELIPAEPGTPEWLAARRQGVTATDIVTILGLSSWSSAYSLYWQKMGQVPETPDNDRFRLGRYMEPYVVERWSQDHNWHNPEYSGLYRHSDRAWQMATLDRTVYDGVPLECKSWADADRHSWEDGPPAAVRAQVLWQMDVMDVATGHVGVVFLPSGEFRSYVIEDVADNAHDQQLMRDRGWEFMQRLRGELPPPDIDASAASMAAVKARFGDARPGKTVSVDGALWERYSAAKDLVAVDSRIARGYENELREQIGEATVIEADGQAVARRRVYDSKVKAHTRHVDGIWRLNDE